MNILIVAMDETRWGPARLPKFLAQAGFVVGALCPPDNPLAHTRFLDSCYELPRSKSAFPIVASLRAALEAFQPNLVIPADEMVVAMLHAVLAGLPGADISHWPPNLLETLHASLCPPQRRNAMLFKNNCQQLARQIGVATPAGGLADTAREALALAQQLSYPVVLKQSFSWGGMGVRLCRDEMELIAGFKAMEQKPIDALVGLAKRMTGRNWYPAPQPLWVQQAIAGDPAMYSFVATNGRMLAGFAGTPRSTSSQTGPSTVVDFGAHAAMAEASRRMVAAMGASGFVSFDFMIERDTGKAFLLECNARPNQVSHLGRRVGVDLCQALFDGMGDKAPSAAAAPLEATGNETITLFPQEWLRAPDSAALKDFYHDTPWDDETLLARCLEAAPSSHPAFLKAVHPAPRESGASAAA